MTRAVITFLFLATRLSAADAPSAAGWIVLPVDEYRTLRAKADPPEPEPASPAAYAVLTRLEYDLEVAGDVARGTARLSLDVMKEGWLAVPIPSGLSVASAHVDGGRVSLRGALGPETRMRLPRRGRSVVTLDVAVPGAHGDAGSILLPVVAGSGVTRAVVVVPHEGVDGAFTGAAVAETSVTARHSRWTAYADGRTPIGFSWRPIANTRPRLPLRLRGAVTQLVGLGEETAQLTADVRIEVVQGAAADVSIDLPADLSINHVSGANVADWETRDGRLRVAFLNEVGASESVIVTGEARCAREGVVEIPMLRLAAAERETGGVAVEILGAGEVTAHDARGMEAVDAVDLGQGIAGRGWGLVDAFRFRPQEGRGPRRLTVTLARYTPQAVLQAAIDEARYQALVTDDGKTLVQARYAVRNNTQSFLVAALPEGSQLWSAAVSGRPVRPGRSGEGALLVPLEKARAGDEAPPFLVELTYLQRGTPWAKEGRARLALPSLDLPVSRTGLVLHHSPQRELRFDPGAFREQAYRPPTSSALTAAPSTAPAAVAAPEDKSQGEEERAAVQGAADRLRKMGAGTHAAGGILPLQVPFPAYGAATFLASELTAERATPIVELAYKMKKGADR